MNLSSASVRLLLLPKIASLALIFLSKSANIQDVKFKEFKERLII